MGGLRVAFSLNSLFSNRRISIQHWFLSSWIAISNIPQLFNNEQLKYLFVLRRSLSIWFIGYNCVFWCYLFYKIDSRQRGTVPERRVSPPIWDFVALYLNGRQALTCHSLETTCVSEFSVLLGVSNRINCSVVDSRIGCKTICYLKFKRGTEWTDWFNGTNIWLWWLPAFSCQALRRRL